MKWLGEPSVILKPMSDTLIAIFFGAGVGAWAYTQLAKRSGNANPGSTMLSAGFVGLIAAIFFFTMFKYVLHF